MLHRSYPTIKTLFDRFFALVLIVLLFPIFIIISFLVSIDLGFPFLFAQKRPGLNGKLFTLYKFRTMRHKKSQDTSLRTDNVRLTNFGRLLRSTSLDELPELFNILLGDMSFVGPRPLLSQYLPLYSPHQFRRHDVLPGITGLAQVNGRNSITWEDKFEYDVAYVKNRSFIFDCKILLRTVLVVLSRRGINSVGSASSLPFLGTIQFTETDS